MSSEAVFEAFLRLYGGLAQERAGNLNCIGEANVERPPFGSECCPFVVTRCCHV